MLNSLINFIKFTHLFQKIKRVVLIPGENRWENDAEHSFQLALTAWYLIEKDRLKLDLSKVLLFSLAHDLVEAYAGDTYVYDTPAVLKRKKEKEKKAAILLKKNFPEFSSLHRLIKEYESKKSPESRFVYALDKVLPAINIYLDNGKTWKLKKITSEKLLNDKKEKISLSPKILHYYEELAKILKKNKKLFFSGKNEG